ncbi:major facilitator superfamily domain-containing protein [Mycena amicta]|nr:major facilitator superfamily domain-containing protein [Mycena amicta]
MAAEYLDVDETKDPFLIDSFEEGDTTNPKNWSRLRRWYLTALAGLLVLNACVASASGIALQIMNEYHLSKELGVLAISLFVAGYCVGPLLWGPLSEQFGRRPIFIYPFIVYTLFQVGAALAKNGASILVFRFLGGVFAAAPLTNSGAIISDIWDANTRGPGFVHLMPFAGPTLGPTCSGFIAVTGTNFRWVFWARPFKILFLEPMLLILTIYMSFIYWEFAYPIVFTEGHRLNAGLSGLTFLPILAGGAAAVTVSVLFFNPRFERKAAELAPHSVPPEFRLEMALVAAPLRGLFLSSWTSFPSISLWAPAMSGFAMGFALNWIFLSLFNYIIDTYLFIAASALAGNTVVRSIFGAVFPLFASQMYEKLGPRWASSLLGFVALVAVPIPVFLMRFGPTIRAKSRYAPTKPTKS